MTTEFYKRPYIRFQPYMIGILFGYILFKTKDQKLKIPHVSSSYINSQKKSKYYQLKIVYSQMLYSI